MREHLDRKTGNLRPVEELFSREPYVRVDMPSSFAPIRKEEKSKVRFLPWNAW